MNPSCGAKFPGYLMKKHPENLQPGTNFEATVCFSKGKTCCTKTQRIKIMKCKDFFIYKLPRSCLKRGRYCGTGSELKFPKWIYSRIDIEWKILFSCNHSKGLNTWARLVSVCWDLGMFVKRNKTQLRDYMTIGLKLFHVIAFAGSARPIKPARVQRAISIPYTS